MYPRYHSHPAARHVVKSHKATPFDSKNFSSNTLHFKAIFDSSLKKIVRGSAVSDRKCASKIGHSLARVKNFGAQHDLGTEIWSFE